MKTEECFWCQTLFEYIFNKCKFRCKNYFTRTRFEFLCSSHSPKIEILKKWHIMTFYYNLITYNIRQRKFFGSTYGFVENREIIFF